MSNKQRLHEDYWGRCWAVALGQHLAAEVRPTRPHEDPPDIDFRIDRPDAPVGSSWGEITGTYYDAAEAKLLWGPPSGNSTGLYVEPDAVVAMRARDLVECKRDKYERLVRCRGRGHLLVLLHSPLTSRSTRVAAEKSILDLMETGRCPTMDPFETVWLGYRLPWTIPAEQEDPQYVYRDEPDSNRFNFLKCVWADSDV